MKQAKTALGPAQHRVAKCSAGSSDPAVLLELIEFHATGALCQSTVGHLRDALSEDEGSITLMQDVQAIMHRYYRANTKIANAVLALSRALDLKAD